MMKVTPKTGSTPNNDGGNNEKRYSMMKFTPKSATNDGELLPVWLLLSDVASAVGSCCYCCDRRSGQPSLLMED
jgi:hypothetical protein